MTHPRPLNQSQAEALLVSLALAAFFGPLRGQARLHLRRQLADAIHQAFAPLSESDKQKLLNLLATVRRKPPLRAPPKVLNWLRQALGQPGLREWLAGRHGPPPSPEALQARVDWWLARATVAGGRALLAAGVRFGVGKETDADRKLLEKSYATLNEKEEHMATFDFDPRGLPPEFDGAAQTAYLTAVNTELQSSFGLPKAGNETEYAAITGMLLLDEQFSPQSLGFRDGLQKVWIEALGKTKHLDGHSVPNSELYASVADIIPTLPGRNGTPIGYQEFGFVCRHVVRGAVDFPIGHPNFATQVRLGLDRYVAGAPPSESLDLPPLTGDDGSDLEIEADNVRAVAMVYSAYQLERARVINVVDRITERFMQGMLPIGYDAAGKALETYYWNAEDRLSEAARLMVYGRVLGVSGADVSKEVQPNRDFDNLFLRFVSSVAEYDRQRRIGDIFDNRNPLALTGETVRKAGRDLAANTSLYGWAGTQSAARFLKDHVLTSFDILKQPSVQKAYGVSNPWQLVERVAASEFGQAPNIVKYRTMAESGKAILDIVSRNTRAWSAVTSTPLFSDGETAGDLQPNDERALFVNTQYWLAVNGIGEDQVGKMSQPSDTSYAPSLPAFGGVSVAPGKNGAGADGALDKIRQMVAAGTAPSLDQLQQMLPGLRS